MDNWSTYGIDKLMMTDYSKGVSSEPLKEVKYYECGDCKQKVSRDAWPSLDKWWANHEKYCPGPAATVVPPPLYPEFKFGPQSSIPVEGSVRVYKEFSDRSLEGEIFYKGEWLPFRTMVESQLRSRTFPSQAKLSEWLWETVPGALWKVKTKPQAITVPLPSSQGLLDVISTAKETKS